MASSTSRARKTADATAETPDATESVSTAPALTLAPRLSEGVKRAAGTGRTATDNPTLDSVRHSRAEGIALAFDGLTEDQVKDVQNMLRRAAKTLDCGLNQSVTPDGNGTFTVDFKALTVKRKRTYTAAEIRAWALVNGHGELIGKIPPHVRDAFKAARVVVDSPASEDENAA